MCACYACVVRVEVGKNELIIAENPIIFMKITLTNTAKMKRTRRSISTIPKLTNPSGFSLITKRRLSQVKTFADRNGLFLFAKVRLLDLVEPRRGQQNYKTYFYKIQAKHVDFVLCDAKLVARWVIELDDASHRRADRAERDTFVDEVLMSTGYTILHMDSFDEKLLEREIIGIDTQ